MCVEVGLYKCFIWRHTGQMMWKSADGVYSAFWRNLKNAVWEIFLYKLHCKGVREFIICTVYKNIAILPYLEILRSNPHFSKPFIEEPF
jgi:hypothetical protein